MIIKCKSVLSVLLLSTYALVSTFPVSASPIQFGSSYYDFVESADISWQDAANAAANSTYMGVNGHLATITSAEENNFLAAQFATFPDFAGSWLGGEVNAFGTGTWITGPETGQIFSQGSSAVSGAYANWGGIEPNGPYPSLAYMNVGTFYSGIATGQWADASSAGGGFDPIKGYFVEYTVVPIPGSVWLFVSALAGIGLFGKRSSLKET